MTVAVKRHGRTYVESIIQARLFGLVYQPIVNLDTGAVLGVEALTRFHDGQSPDTWFARVQELGLATALDLAIFELALADIDQLPDGYLALNVSPQTLAAAPELVDMLRPALNRRQLMLELTERVVVEDYALLRHQLAPIRDAGILLAIDDVGSGYSSLQHIVRLRPDVFKLDRSFIASIDTDTACRAFAVGAAVMGREMGATVIAEGVETAAEVATLRSADVAVAQGFYLGRPQHLPLAYPTYAPEPHVDRVGNAEPRAHDRLQQALEAIRQATNLLRHDDISSSVGTREALCRRIARDLTYLEQAVARLPHQPLTERRIHPR